MEKETLKSLRAKAKELRSKVSSAPLSKATPDQLRSEILMLERAVKAEEKALAKKAEKEEQKKKSTPSIVPQKEKAVPKMTDREKELIRREKELAKKEKMMLSYKPPKQTMSFRQEREDTSDSEDY